MSTSGARRRDPEVNPIMDAPLNPQRLSRRRFLATVGAAAAGGAAVTFAAVELAGRGSAAPPAPLPSAAALAALAGSPSPSPAAPSPSADYSAFRHHYRSRPDLTPPQVLVQVTAAKVAPGLLFFTPSNGTGTDGPAIVDNDGELVWLRAGTGSQVADFQVAEVNGERVLAWWEGSLNGGIGTGEVVLADSTYREIGRVKAGNGRKADLHEFHITGQGTVLLFADAGVAATRASDGAGKSGQVLDCAVQEIDLRTGEVRFEWHTVDNIAIAESYVPATTDPNAIYDYVHGNSIDVDHDGNILVSARNTSAVYKVNRTTGDIMWRLGGKRSDFTMGAGTTFGWQHDVRRQPDGALTMFDDDSTPTPSRALVLKLDEVAMTASLVRAYPHPKSLFARSQGNMQVLPGGNVLVGWGDTAYVSEFTASGELIFDAAYPAATQSYRDYRSAWTGRPVEPPTVAAVAGADGHVTAFASWNGATQVASWDVLAGPNAASLTAAGSAPRSGFETSIPVRGRAAIVRAVARDSSGAILGTSAPVPVTT